MELLSETCLSDVTDDGPDSPRSAVSVNEDTPVGAAEVAATARRPVAHTIQFWEHISPAKQGSRPPRLQSMPVVIRRLQQAPGQECHAVMEQVKKKSPLRCGARWCMFLNR